MRIGLISDTHIPTVADALPSGVEEAFRGVDLILHAGDIYALSVLNDLEKIAPVLAARGDDDSGATLADKRVKEKHILKLEGKTLWLIHEKPWAMNSTRLAEWWRSRLNPEQDKLGQPDIVVFGHAHTTFIQQADNTLFVSSGSPTFLHYKRGPGTVAILELNTDAPDVSIIQL